MSNETMQYGLTVKCIHCGCKKQILPGEVPIGDCKFCFENFGWLRFPGDNKDFALQDGDIITVNTRVPVDSPRRIFEVRRNHIVIYHDSGEKL